MWKHGDVGVICERAQGMRQRGSVGGIIEGIKGNKILK